MCTIVRLFTTKTRAAELVLIATLARFKSARLFQLPPRREGRAMHVGGAYPNTAPARTRGANVVVHLPTRAKRVLFVRGADSFDHFAPHRITKISQAIQRLERANLITKFLFCFECSVADISCVLKHTLLIPRVVGRRSRESIAWISLEPVQQMVQPSGPGLCPAFKKNHNVSIRICGQPVETRGCTGRLSGSGLRDVSQRTQRLYQARIRTIRQEHQLKSRSSVAPQSVNR